VDFEPFSTTIDGISHIFFDQTIDVGIHLQGDHSLSGQ
jgi:hypothetical protein